MSGQQCAISTCNSHYRKTKGLGVTYHAFPAYRSVRKIWIAKCKRGDKFNAGNARICSRHFTPQDYDVHVINETLGIPYKRKLKRTAVPTLFLDGNNISCKEMTSPVEDERLTSELQPQKKTRSQRYEDRTNERHKSEVQVRALKRILDLPLEDKYQDKETNTPEDKMKAVLEEHKIATDENKSLKAANVRLQNANLKLMKKLHQTKAQAILLQRRYKNLIAVRQRKLLTGKRSIHLAVNDKVKRILKSVFTSGQIQSLLKGNKRVKWNVEDIAAALSLKAVSKEAYECLRRQGFPLPGCSTLRRWSKHFKCEEAIDTIVCYDHNLDEIQEPQTFINT